MTPKTLNKQKGFTIVEVMIVIAIAGLILLIVFLAVPALQRNSRNTQRKNDVSAIIAAVNEWSNNNNGDLPSSSAERTSAANNAELGFYDSVNWEGTSWPGVDAVNIVTGEKCDGEDASVPQARSVAVQYQVETSGSPVEQCDGS